MNNRTNFVQIDAKGLTGNIASIAFDIDIVGEPVSSENENAPRYRVFTQSPRGRQVEIGAIWERLNRDGKPYFALSITTGHARFHANLGRYPGQDDETLYAVIPNDHFNFDRRI